MSPRLVTGVASVLVLCLTPALALDGRIVTSDGTPLEAALLSVSGLVPAQADAEGRFVLRPDPVPPFDLVVLPPGGEAAFTVRIEAVPAAGTLEVVVPAVGETVTVSAPGPALVPVAPAGAVTTLREEEIGKRLPARMADALADVPGLAVTGQGPDAVPSLRGMARGRTLLLLDGGRVSSERRAGANAQFLDPGSLESLEVVRGPGSVAYGSDALGGILHARTRTPDPRAGWSGTVQGLAGAGIPEWGLSAEAAGEGWRVRVRERDQDDWDAPSGTVPNSGASDRGLALGRAWDGRLGEVVLGLRVDQGRDIGKPVTSTATTSILYPEDDSTRLTGSWTSRPVGPWARLQVEAYAGASELVTDQRGDVLARSDVEARDLGLRGIAERRIGGALLQVGADLAGRLVDATTFDGSVEQTAMDGARRLGAGLFASAEQPLGPRWTLGAGLRADLVRTRIEEGTFGPRSSGEEPVSGYLALTAATSARSTLALQVSRGHREPTLSDLYYVGISGRGFVTGNPDLVPETARQADLTWRGRGARWSAAASGYVYVLDDFVERIRLPVPGRPFTFRNAGRAVIHGAEVEGAGRLPFGLDLRAGIQAARGRIEGEDVPPDDVPGPSAFVRLDRAWSAWRAGARIAAFARDERPGAGEVVMPGHALLDLTAGWSPLPGIDLDLVLRNVLDRAYPAAPEDGAPEAPGRSAALAVTARWPRVLPSPPSGGGRS